MPTTNIDKILGLGVGYGQLGLSEETRNLFIKEIDRQQKTINTERRDVWTGDLNHFSTLHKTDLFKPLFKNLGECVREYCKNIGTNPSFFDFNVVRSWGTKALTEQNIPIHAHSYASIAAVYYPKVPQNSGGIILGAETDHNELIPDLMSSESYEQNILSSSNEFSARGIKIDPLNDSYIVFPAKTSHCTTPNLTEEPRYSIAIDIVMTLKETSNIEYCLPPIKNWEII